jgi:hypothetical protein
MPATDPLFGIGDQNLHGTLTTYAEFDGTYQVYRPESKKHVGWIPTVTGYIHGYYENSVGVIQGTAEFTVKPGQSRDGIV